MFNEIIQSDQLSLLKMRTDVSLKGLFELYLDNSTPKQNQL